MLPRQGHTTPHCMGRPFSQSHTGVSRCTPCNSGHHSPRQASTARTIHILVRGTVGRLQMMPLVKYALSSGTVCHQWAGVKAHTHSSSKRNLQRHNMHMQLLRPGCGPSSTTCPARVHLITQHGPPVDTMIQRRQGMRAPAQCGLGMPKTAPLGCDSMPREDTGHPKHAGSSNSSRAGCTKQITTSDQGTQRSVHFTAAPAANNRTSQSTNTQRDTMPTPCMCASDKTVHRTVIVHYGRAQHSHQHRPINCNRAGFTDVCAQHAQSHIHATNTPHTAVKYVTLTPVPQPDDAARGEPRQHKGCGSPPAHRHARTGCSIYAEEADGTRQASSPARRVLSASAAVAIGPAKGHAKGKCAHRKAPNANIWRRTGRAVHARKIHRH